MSGALLAVVRPTLGQLAGVVFFLLFRLTAWSARGAFERPDARLMHGVLGLTYDVLLVSALFWLGRAAALSLGRASFRAAALPTLAGWLALSLRCLDLGHCYLVQCHWAPEAFLYLRGGFAGALLDPGILAAMIVAGLAFAGWPWALRYDQRRALQRLALPALDEPAQPRRRRLSVAVALVIGATGLSAVPVYDAISAPEDVFNLRLIPEINFAVQARAWYRADERSHVVTPLSPGLRQRLVSAGLLHAATPILPGYPLVRRGLAEPGFPHPRSQSASPTTRPNVVMAVVESLDALFVHELSGAFRGVMPEVSALARQHTVVAGFHNTATPTVSALIAMLCSIHPPTYPKDLEGGRDGLAAYTCLSDLLHYAGYRTVFVQGTPASMTGIGDFLRLHGFDEVHEKRDIERRFPARIMGKWGAHDRTLIDYVQAQIRRLEALKEADGKPYLLLFMTIDTHEPGMAAEACVLPTTPAGDLDVGDAPEGEGARGLLASYHCTDRVLGDFFRFLAAPARAADTMWLLTGDHSAFRTPNSRELFADRHTGWSFAALPLLLHDPRHRLPLRVPVLSGTLDIAPTLLHMLGIHVGLHSLTGLSIFGRRPHIPFLLGRIGGRVAYVQTPQARHEASVASLHAICDGGTLLLPKGPQPLDACDVLQWIRWQDELWQARRLFPRTLYWGEERK